MTISRIPELSSRITALKNGEMDIVTNVPPDQLSVIDGDPKLKLADMVTPIFHVVIFNSQHPKMADPMAGPRLHFRGNHDRDHLHVADNEAVPGQALGHTTVDIGGWRLVLWRANSRIRRPARDGMHGFVLAESDLRWLTDVVRKADRPLLFLSHVPPSGHSQTSNNCFERNPQLSTYLEANRLRAVLRRSRVPVVCVAGHVHWNTLALVDGIPHLMLQSLTESFTIHPGPAAAWRLLELADPARGQTIDWRVLGQDPFAARLDAATAGRR